MILVDFFFIKIERKKNTRRVQLDVSWSGFTDVVICHEVKLSSCSLTFHNRETKSCNCCTIFYGHQRRKDIYNEFSIYYTCIKYNL